MKKQTLALVVAGLFATPFAAQADGINLVVYGKIRAGVEYVDNDTDSQGRVVSNASRLGFKGEETITEGLKGIWQIEGGVEADGDNEAKLNSRNTFVGLQGGFGKVLVGQHDTPYKLNEAYINPISDTLADNTAIFGKGAGQKFRTRQNSTVQYYSPSLGGFEFALGAASSNETITDEQDSLRLSGSLAYKTENFYVGLGLENRNEITVNEDANAVRLVAGATFGDFKAGVGVEQIDYNNTKHQNFTTALEYNIGKKFKLAGTYTYGKTKDVSGDKARQISFAGFYNITKRTEVQAYVSQISNGVASAVDFGTNPVTKVDADKNPIGFGIAVNHAF